jgi:hypothetical protein
MKKVKLTRTADIVYYVGDIHGYFELFSEDLKEWSEKYPDKNIVVIQCGDFGFWPEIAPIEKLIVPSNVEIFACAGNHENWNWLDTFEYTPTEIASRVWYMPFGSTLTLNENVHVFCGGAGSVDKKCRVVNVSWWTQEGISQLDLKQLDHVDHVDTVISHTLPNHYSPIDHYKNGLYDYSRHGLDYVFEKYKPKNWYCGHWHVYETGVTDGVQITILSDITNSLCNVRNTYYVEINKE